MFYSPRPSTANRQSQCLSNSLSLSRS
ncbi:unnamed protein product [Cuscuta europaea]|uniref:Uncharacterized protein n=1 Tax=Cuscuta europaea TaxID=41803 RepID=A0A9P1E1E7_CUSEU|nr:unnamed protein product [Cuscuta europaea]